MEYKEFVEDLSKKARRRYQDDYSIMIADYNREKETIKGYNGRQLLELLQNCDDEGAKKVTFSLDTTNRIISIKNDGNTSFSEKGYRSLFISNLSSKTEKKKYIGNKGLGFRSIINWSNAIEVISNNLSLKYSTKNSKTNFKSLFSEEESSYIYKNENISEQIVPIPFLTLPYISEAKHEGYKTIIKIHYKEQSLDDIYKQIEQITPEVLLFLRNIECINFEGFENKKNIRSNRTKLNTNNFAPSEKLTFETDEWLIFSTEKLLPEEYQDDATAKNEHYQIKIAIDKKFKKTDERLFSFFPTNIKLKQPYVLHATFDLDATRNQLNNSKKNKFLLKQVVEFTIQVAKYFSREAVSYQPLQILSHQHTADTLENLDYYEYIDEAITTQEIFPCVDKTYKKLDEVVYLNDKFSYLLTKIEENPIPFHLIPKRDFNLSTDVDFIDRVDELDVAINTIAKQELTIYQRADLIQSICLYQHQLSKLLAGKISVLINDGKKVIENTEFVYTPVTKDNTLKTPSFSKIEFINSNLFEVLLERFNYSSSQTPNKGRFIYDKLKDFFNIHSYEPATLAQKIISETNKRIGNNEETKKEDLVEMHQCLFHNYQLMNEDTKLPDDKVKIKCFNKIGEIVNTEDLVLSSLYPTGKLTELIFENVYDDVNYVTSKEEIGLSDKTIENVQDYLKWIKVNQFVRYKTIEEDSYTFKDDGYISKLKNLGKLDTYTSYKIEYLTIYNLDKILNKLELEKLLLWIHFDKKLRDKLELQNSQKFSSHYRRSYKYPSNYPSYLQYKISKYFNFEDYLIDEKNGWINDYKLNYSELIKIDNAITRTEINSYLIKLGAKEDFGELPLSKIIKVLNNLPLRFKDGKKTQSFYKKALNHYKSNEIAIDEKLQLFANNGIEKKVYANNEIYFSDKIKIPNKLKKDFPIFNFPARSGGSDAVKFFGINDLKDIKLEITHTEINPYLSNQFEILLNDLKPYILSYRLNVIEGSEARKTQASLTKKITIILSNKLSYSVNNSEYEVEDYEFLHEKEQTYHIKVTEDDTIHSLKKNTKFVNSFANILATAFDVNQDIDRYKLMLRANLEDIKNTLFEEVGDDEFLEARELLGLADYKQTFWEAIFNCKGYEYNDSLDDTALEQLIKEELQLDIDTQTINYEELNHKLEIEKIKLIFNDLGINLKEFNNNYHYKLQLNKIHEKDLVNTILDNSNRVKSSIWKHLSNKSIDEKKQFLELVNKYELYNDFVTSKSNELKYLFEFDKELIFKEYFQSKYPEISISEVLDYELVKTKNQLEFTNEEIIEIINPNINLSSLIFFSDGLNYIKNYLGELKLVTEEELKEDIKTNSLDVEIINSDFLKGISTTDKTSNLFSSAYRAPSSKKNRNQKIKGNKAEDIVFNHLKCQSQYFNIDKVSEFNEGLHYDIRYTNENGIVKYVEVKSFDQNKFHLSKDEYEFGQDKQENYEIWLVRGEKIIQIKDFFTNPKYKVTPKEYVVYISLNE